MSLMQWVTDFQTALEKANSTGLPVFQDFWFDG
jgi:hypothetical protein